MTRADGDEVRRVAKTQTQQALENLSMQIGSERAWRMAFEMELRWRKAAARVVELEQELAGRRRPRGVGKGWMKASLIPGVIVRRPRKKKRGGK